VQGLGWMIARRLIGVPFVVLGVTFLIFVAIDLAPADPATAALGTFSTQAQRTQFAREHGLDDPLPVRFVRFVGDVAHGDFGQSALRSEAVGPALAAALPVTLQLTGLALLLAIVLATCAGTLAALHRDRWPDRMIRTGFSAGLAAPDFWLGILAIQLVAVKLQLLPSSGFVPIGQDPGAWLRSLILPATVLAIPVASALTAVIRTSVAGELDRDYVRTAVGAGLPTTRVVAGHVLRNAAVAPLTVLGIRAGYLVGGAIIVEQIFTIPGLGTLLITGVQQGDLAPVRGVAIVGTLLFVLVNLVVDLIQLVLDPRLRHSS
jgi:peptide/nickel transport system permease protein